MRESVWQGVKRRRQNMQWAWQGLDMWVGPDGRLYEGADVARILSEESDV